MVTAVRAPQTHITGLGRWRHFLALTKPRIIELLLVTTIPTMFVAQRGLPSISLMFYTLIGGALAAGGANAFNMYIDRDIDHLMERTARRPLVTGAIKPWEAKLFAYVLEIAAFLWLSLTVNYLSAVLAVAACLFYVFIYTLWLKRSNEQNIVIGGAAGAVPALVGWSAVTNELALAPWILFAVIFFWTPPHFWALAIKYENDYKNASVPMMPAVAGHSNTALQMTVYAAITWFFSLGFAAAAEMGVIYITTALIAGAMFTWKALRLYLSKNTSIQAQQAIKYFQFSITYLTILFVAMAVDQLVGWGP